MNNSSKYHQNNLNNLKLSDLDNEQLEREKKEARKRLNAMVPSSAQELVNQTLFPQYWKFNSSDNIWSESMTTYYGEEE